MEQFPEKEPNLSIEDELRALLSQTAAERDQYRAELGVAQNELSQAKGDLTELLDDLIPLVSRSYRHEREAHEANQKAMTDSLTGAHNRLGLEVFWNNFVASKSERKQDQAMQDIPAGTIFCIDIDHFKAINDGLTHDVGDQVLMTVVDTLKAQLRRTDVLARVGGDEIVAVLPRASHEDAEKVSEKCRKSIADIEEINGHPLKTTVSIGVSEINPDLDLRENLHLADVALYEAKNNGRNQVQFADPGIAS
jgi:diguanylate cyclase (GGDEF)-like protein